MRPPHKLDPFLHSLEVPICYITLFVVEEKLVKEGKTQLLLQWLLFPSAVSLCKYLNFSKLQFPHNVFHQI